MKCRVEKSEIGGKIECPANKIFLIILLSMANDARKIALCV